MILADTSIWVQHFRFGEPLLVELLTRGDILMHPFVIGELALGSLGDRDIVLDSLQALPSAGLAQMEEVLLLVERRRLFARGIGYVDACLIASTLLTDGTRLWTRDRRLKAVAVELVIEFAQPAADRG